jgi:hypothetical protein
MINSTERSLAKEGKVSKEVVICSVMATTKHDERLGYVIMAHCHFSTAFVERAVRYPRPRHIKYEFNVQRSTFGAFGRFVGGRRRSRAM